MGWSSHDADASHALHRWSFGNRPALRASVACDALTLFFLGCAYSRGRGVRVGAARRRTAKNRLIFLCVGSLLLRSTYRFVYWGVVPTGFTICGV